MKRYIMLCLVLTWPALALAQMSISLPIPGVYQSTGTYTSVELAGQYIGSALSNYRIEYNVLRLNVNDGSFNSYYQQSYTTITTNPTYGLYRTTLSLPIGWYQINVQVWNISTNSGGTSNSTRFGVGDVYVIAGQSNAQGALDGSNSWSVPSVSTYDGILSHNWSNGCLGDVTYNGNTFQKLPSYPVMTSLSGLNAIAPSGNNSWNWAYLGSQLQSGAPTGGLPLAFFNAAQGGSTSLNWRESAYGTTTTNIYSGSSWCDTGSGYSGSPQPYNNFKLTLQYYASIFGTKAVLWHQGESDNDREKGNPTTTTNYYNRIDSLIKKTENDFSSSLGWLISEASYFGKNPTYAGSGTETSSQVTSAQSSLGATYKYGVSTDDLGNSYREPEGGAYVHFSESQNSALTVVGGRWNTKIGNQTLTSIGATTPPTITMTKSGNNWTLSVPAVYSAYRWINMGSSDPNAPVGTGLSYKTSCCVMN